MPRRLSGCDRNGNNTSHLSPFFIPIFIQTSSPSSRTQIEQTSQSSLDKFISSQQKLAPAPKSQGQTISTEPPQKDICDRFSSQPKFDSRFSDPPSSHLTNSARDAHHVPADNGRALLDPSLASIFILMLHLMIGSLGLSIGRNSSQESNDGSSLSSFAFKVCAFLVSSA